MAQNTFALMTNLGRAKEAAAIANGTAVVITHIAIGDGTTIPSGGETTLYHEVARKAISGHGTVVGASNVAYFDIFLEAAEGPYTIREAGLIDRDGDLIAIARYDPPISKPIPSSGQTVEGTIRLEIAFSNIAAITVVVDPAFNVTLQRINRLPWLPILSMTLATPPTTPSVGDVYLVPTGATGAWSGQAGKIAEYTSAGWGIISPPEGHGVSLPDGRVFERVGAAYVEKIALDAQSGKWGYAVAGGTANALTATLSPAPSSYSPGMVLAIRVSINNTGPATININGLGMKAITRGDGSPLQKDDLVSGQIASLMYDGTGWQVDGLKSSQTPPRNAQTFTTVGLSNFIVPDGIYKVFVRLCGGGGGGAGMNNGPQAGGGGGSGGYAEGWCSVVPGQTVPVTIGSGGSGGNLGSNGGAGGTTSFGSYMSATGGGGGSAQPGAPAGGGPGVGVGGTVNQYGGIGTDGHPNGSIYGGNGGGSAFGGGGRSSIGSPGVAGLAPGSGGGSAYGTTLQNGGNGAAGIVIVQW